MSFLNFPLKYSKISIFAKIECVSVMSNESLTIYAMLFFSAHENTLCTGIMNVFTYMEI